MGSVLALTGLRFALACLYSVLPGSHLPIADHWERTITDPAHLAQLPRVHGLSPGRAGSTYQKVHTHARTFRDVSGSPSLSQHPWVAQVPECSPLGRWADQTPVAAVAERGQCLVFTQALLHSAWQNEDSVSRCALVRCFFGCIGCRTTSTFKAAAHLQP